MRADDKRKFQKTETMSETDCSYLKLAKNWAGHKCKKHSLFGSNEKISDFQCIICTYILKKLGKVLRLN